jgi:alkylated DNA repair dioxygenase AlkB
MPVLQLPVIYVPGFIQNPNECFATLKSELDWVHHDKVPRKEYYVNDIAAPYSYGNPQFSRTYQPQAWHPLLREHQEQLQDYLGYPMEVCFLNLYQDGKDQLGEHADDSPEMDPARAIVTISLGEEREIWFRPNEAEAWRLVDEYYGDFKADANLRQLLFDHYRQWQRLLLENGSMAIMPPGMQQTWTHRIPKSSKHECGPRMSETWRGYVQL